MSTSAHDDWMDDDADRLDLTYDECFACERVAWITQMEGFCKECFAVYLAAYTEEE